MPITRSPRIVAGVAIALLAVVLAGCSTSSADGVSANDTRYVVNGAGVVTTYAIGHRKPAPQITGIDLSGKPMSLTQFKGKVIVLNFWASWCPPCRAEAPALQEVSTKTASMGVQFVGVDIRENGRSDGLAFVSNNHIGYPSFFDSSAQIALKFRSSGVVPQTPPTTLVIDRNGRIAARGLGEMRVSQLTALVDDVANEATG